MKLPFARRADRVASKIKARVISRSLKPFARRPDGLFFYQACDLPKIGFVPGAWDHRGTEDAYLGNTDFTGLTAIDVGPANGFWSFEMERRGADVVALELGADDRWDEVPHTIGAQPDLTNAIAFSVSTVHSDFLKCKGALASKVEVVRGTAYSIDSIIAPVDAALMGNVLQHLRDPFLAIERVAGRVLKRIIISEAFWIDDDYMLDRPLLSLIPAAANPTINHSWYQASPAFVREVLGILGFQNIQSKIHWQAFHGTQTGETPRMVRHFTVTGDR